MTISIWKLLFLCFGRKFSNNLEEFIAYVHIKLLQTYIQTNTDHCTQNIFVWRYEKKKRDICICTNKNKNTPKTKTICLHLLMIMMLIIIIIMRRIFYIINYKFSYSKQLNSLNICFCSSFSIFLQHIFRNNSIITSIYNVAVCSSS